MFQTTTNTEHQIRPPSSAPSSPHAGEHGDILITKQLGTPSYSPSSPTELVRAPWICPDKATVFSCNICNQSFKGLALLDNHIRASHLSLHCSLCDRTLRSKPDLNYHHHKLHSSVNPVNDDVDISTASSVPDNQCNLSKAMSENKEVNYLNIESAELESSPAYLVMSESFNLRQHKCTPCDELFECKEMLITHMSQQHYISSFYTCQKCEKAFENREFLDLHLHIDHNISDTAACDSCQEVYINRTDLEHHTCDHQLKNQAFACNNCISVYPKKEALNNHIQSKHEPSLDVSSLNVQCSPASSNNSVMINHIL